MRSSPIAKPRPCSRKNACTPLPASRLNRLARGRPRVAFRSMAADVSIVAALVAGLVSFLSPCVLPLVAPYLVYLAGTSVELIAAHQLPARVRRDTVAAALLFVAGFSTIFVALGAAASTVGTGLRRLQALLGDWLTALNSTTGMHLPTGIDPFGVIAGIIIILMGLHFPGVTPIALLHREARWHVQKPVSLWGAYVMGL